MKKTGNEPNFFWQETSAFRQSIISSYPTLENGRAELIIRFLYTTGASQVLTTLENSSTISKKTIQKVIDQCIEIVLSGIHSGTTGNMPNPDTILAACRIGNDIDAEGGKLFSAIARVVAKEGLAGATTDKIAEEIGITKSSLYFHFKNKQDMLNEMLLDNQQKFMELFRQQTQVYSNVEEKIICYMGLVGIWLLQDPTLLTVYTWLWFQRLELQLEPPEDAIQEEINTLFRTAINGGQIKSLGLSEKQLAAFLIRLVGQEVQLAIREGRNSSYKVSELSQIIVLLFRGIHHYIRGGKK
jgi:AcrR family transcriptional regulator